ncbi:MAG: LytR C-terminal domain-containing protein [Elusimicrobiota bacterium]
MRLSNKRLRAIRIGQGLFAAFLAMIVAIILLDATSPIAKLLREERPVVGLLSVRSKEQGRVVPPALYLLVYGPVARTADLVLIPASTRLPKWMRRWNRRTLADVYGNAYVPEGNIPRASRAMGEAALEFLTETAPWPKGAGHPDKAFRIQTRLSGGVRPGFPGEMRTWIAARARSPFLWLRLFLATPTILFDEASGLGAYDMLLLARELRRLGPRRFHLSQLADQRLAGPLLGRVFARAAGLPPPSGPATVEVLNAAGTAGVALKATKLLRLRGFDVVHFGNARSRERRVRVIDRGGQTTAARSILEVLGCPGTDVLTSLEHRPRAGVTVVLGREYTRCVHLATR